jgi:hypothetical protein
MKNHDFDDLLAELRRTKAPPLPGSFISDVLRDIRLQRAAAAESDSRWFSALVQWCRPRLLAATLAVTVMVGLVLPQVTTAHSLSQEMAAANLDLNIFSPASLRIPSGLLAKAP